MRRTDRTVALLTALALVGIGVVNTSLDVSNAAAKSATYTMAQVRQHATAKRCWTVVNRNVYDLTKWINRHPGGPRVIKAMCGIDSTAAFRAQHGLRGIAASRLAGFRIGRLRVAVGPSPTPPGSNALTLAGVATHRTAKDCWTVVNGTVYDVTAWISRHPGGPAVITAMCGIDASAAFTGMHGKQAKPLSMLAGFRLGPLQIAGPPPAPDTNTVTETVTIGETATAGTMLSAAEVARHSTPADCWSIVNGTVYVLTNWVGAHPGGAAYIAAMCGTDASAAFTNKHGGSATAQARLASFAIGPVGSTVGEVVAPPAPPATGGGGGAVTPPSPTGPGTNGETLTLSIVAQHNAAANCWTVVNSGVYDLTNWVDAHPGGRGPILAMCGVDSSAAFTTKHSASATAQARLSAFRIGTLGSPATVGTPPPAPVPANTIYTATDVRAHATAADCWSVVNTTVYDLTGWIARHPGGRAIIIAACGKNATNAFVSQEHHGATEYKVLEGFAIGAVTPADAASLVAAPRTV